MVVVAGACLIAAAETGLSAQPARVAPVLRARGADQAPAAVQLPLDERAQDVKNELRRILEQYPPALGRVLKLDPTLMTNEAYLRPYPVLAAFLQAHPDVPHYATFFLDFVDTGDNDWNRAYDPRRDTIETLRDMAAGTAVLTGFLMAVLTLTWLVRYIVNHRRWLRATKVQTEVHGRLLERLSSNEDLLAYIQSPVGSQFLKGLPSAPDAALTPAPMSRILWSAQVGLVLISTGIGSLILRAYAVDPDLRVFFPAVGIVIISVGVGFLLAGASSYVLSRRLGLLDKPSADVRGGA
jgi:hypothetical protein